MSISTVRDLKFLGLKSDSSAVGFSLALVALQKNWKERSQRSRVLSPSLPVEMYVPAPHHVCPLLVTSGHKLAEPKGFVIRFSHSRPA